MNKRLTLLSFSRSGFFFKMSFTICICVGESDSVSDVLTMRFGVEFLSDVSARSSSCSARLNSSTVLSRLSETFSFLAAVAEAADAGGRPLLLGTGLELVAAGDEATLLEAAKGVDGEDVEEFSSLEVVFTAPGLRENRTDFRGADPPDFSVEGFKIGFVGEDVSMI